MSANPPPTGVCVVRIEAQRSGVLITLRTNPDIEQVSTERVVVVGDVGVASELVREFLTGFAHAFRSGGAPGPAPPL